MSRIGKSPINVPDGVKVEASDSIVVVSGAKGKLEIILPQTIEIKKEEKHLVLTRKNENGSTKALHGLFRMLIANMVTGVSIGFEKTLELSGVGYRAALQGKNLSLSVGYSHPVEIPPPNGITFVVEGQNKVKVIGIDKQLVGQVAADVRAVREVEPYKGKGIKYIGEQVRRKAGKAAKAGPGAA
ncbi:50S ribosomal protein L6 [Candidatus Saganbacteria bacterium]|nr:50S ribosomal protein L6 [Candidatus Saganbacteria bacterium]